MKMKVDVVELTPVRKKISIEVSAEAVSLEYKKALKKVAGQARIRGFRPGKAPRSLLERRFGSVIREQVAETVLSQVIPDAMEELELSPLGRPQVHEIGEVRDGEELQTVIEVEVLPTLAFDGVGVAFKADTVKADAQDLTERLVQLQQSKAQMLEVEDKAETGDVVAVSYQLTNLEGESGETEERTVRVGSEGDLEWLQSLITGLTQGVDFSGEVELPSQGDHSFSGEKVNVAGQVKAVRRRNIPELGEALAKDLGHEDFESLESATRTEVEAEASRKSKQLLHTAVIEGLLEQEEIHCPSSLVERELTNRLQSILGMNPAQSQGLLDRLGDIRDTLRPEAIKAVQRALVVMHLSEKHGVEVSDEEVNTRINELMIEMPEYKAQIEKNYKTGEQRESLRSMVKEEKTLDFLVENGERADGEQFSLASLAQRALPSTDDGEIDEQPSDAADDGAATDAGSSAPL
jgi:trigger factor